MSKYTNYAQPMGYYVPGGDLVLKLDRGWSEAKPTKKVKGKVATLVLVTRPDVRRILRIDDNPMVVTVSANEPDTIAAFLARSSASSSAHVLKFDEMAATAKRGREAVKTLASIGEFIAEARALLNK